jgi:hypothetical protein
MYLLQPFVHRFDRLGHVLDLSIQVMRLHILYLIVDDRCVGKENISFDDVLVLYGRKCFVYYFKGDADLIDMEINRQKIQEELQFIKSFQ